MYRRDVPLIKEYVRRKGEEGLLDVASFVLCSIQVPLSRTGEMVKEVKREGASASCLWGFKSGGYTHLRKHLTPLYSALFAPQTDDYSAVRLLLDTPGLGLPKVSFLLQCIGYDLACLDVHNLKRLNLSASITKVSPKLKEETKEKKIKDYISLVQKKGSEYWWDSWCKHVSGNRWNKSLPTADEVSYYHYQAITGES